MVSTRGVKLKFMENERVLCYEPDPTKAKVLYDSKVLDVIINKDPKGKKNIEYLIHFQGWNSSWDRCVSEEFVLKDTPENRQLQKDLAEKSQLHLGAYLYRKERKKNRKAGVSGTTPGVASEDGSSGSPARPDTDTTSGEESSGEDDTIVIELSDDIKAILEHDHNLVNNCNKLLKFPGQPNVISILEMFWKHFVTNLFSGLNERPNSRQRQTNNQTRLKPEDIQKKLNLCKEVVDGIRIYFDTIMVKHLLYGKERTKVPPTKMAVYLSLSESSKMFPGGLKTERNQQQNNFHHAEDSNKNGQSSHVNERRRTLRSNQKQEVQTNGNTASTEAVSSNNIVPQASSSVASSTSDVSNPMAKALSWQLLPEHVYHQDPPPPSLIYGATHLLRLFVKLPMFLNASSIPEEKMKVLLPHFDLFLDFMAEHKDWYGDEFYYDADTN